ncbi:hypothetical protein TNCV_4825931 [Trichonephila clavipes]|uniref:Uncharacterized protein n=1 Tax=Trichonephila clavipes TaxID=2585209 RepID=A0A8X6V1C6_TRICX|nr:hypothetical protein TNCV_4825931 [Trichonephila clavipes]
MFGAIHRAYGGVVLFFREKVIDPRARRGVTENIRPSCKVRFGPQAVSSKGYGEGCGSRPVVKVPDRGRYVMSSSQVPLKTRHVGQRYTSNLSRTETSSRWCGVVVRRGGTSSGVVHVT